jgi:hypothetical protein
MTLEYVCQSTYQEDNTWLCWILSRTSGRAYTLALIPAPHLIESQGHHHARAGPAKGGVLIVDEAHMLYTSRANGEKSSDVFRRAIIDAIVVQT